jgi:hypothetical protein
MSVGGGCKQVEWERSSNLHQVVLSATEASSRDEIAPELFVGPRLLYNSPPLESPSLFVALLLIVYTLHDNLPTCFHDLLYTRAKDVAMEQAGIQHLA